jgi:hypothetical protein
LQNSGPDCACRKILEDRGGAEEDEKTNVSTICLGNGTFTNMSSRAYYERNNDLIQQYIYIDRLLDSSLPHDLLNEYSNTPSTSRSSGPIGSAIESVDVPPTITEEVQTQSPGNASPAEPSNSSNAMGTFPKKVKRTPRELYKVSNENSALLSPPDDDEDEEDGPKPEIPGMEDDSVESGDRIVQVAIYINLVANAILLAGKIVVIVLTSSLSVLASLVDAALDFLSTGIVWTTTRMIEHQDQYSYPVSTSEAMFKDSS